MLSIKAKKHETYGKREEEKKKRLENWIWKKILFEIQSIRFGFDLVENQMRKCFIDILFTR